MTELANDRRPIESISWDDAKGSGFTVGSNGCTKIEAYEENGEYCMLPMLAVFVGDEIKARIPAYKVSVFYTVPGSWR